VGGVAAAVRTRTVTDYVSVAPADRGELWTGVVAGVRDLGDESTAADDRCTGYARLAATAAGCVVTGIVDRWRGRGRAGLFWSGRGVGPTLMACR
jgi:hypothetical protein